MEFVPGSATLVLVGIWNPGILNPDWLARYVFNKEPGKETPVTFEFTPFPGLPPRLTIEGLTFQPGRTRIIINLPNTVAIEDAELDKIDSAAAVLFKELPHTPIEAIGKNLEFVENAPTPEQLEIFAASNDLPEKCDFLFETKTQKLVTTIAFEGRTLNLTRTFDNGRLSIQFNFHYGVTSASNASEKVTGVHSFREDYKYALRMIQSLYGVKPAAKQGEVVHV